MNFYKTLFLTFFLFFSIIGVSNKLNNENKSKIQTQELGEKYTNYKYGDYNDYLKKQNIETNDVQKNDYNEENIFIFFKYLGYILILIIVLIIIYFIYKNKGVGLFNKNEKKINYDVNLENVTEVDINELLQKALNEKNNELAIRFYFLKLLKILANKNYIKWHADKTNIQYYYEIKNPELKKDFEYASYLYTYIWFGKHEISEDLFLNAQNHFKTILSRY